MVMRYYGSKSGLFSAAVDVDLYLEKISPASPRKLGEALARHFVSRWEGELSDDVTTLLLRSSATNRDAAEHMRTIFDTQVTKFVRDRISGGADAGTRAGLVSSQLLGLALSRYVLELPPIAGMDVDTLVESVAPVLQYYLTADLGTTVRRRRTGGGPTRGTGGRSAGRSGAVRPV